MINYLGLGVAVILALFFRADSGPVVKTGCIISMGILAWLLFRTNTAKQEPQNEEQESKSHKSQRIHIEYVCHFTMQEGSEATPIVSGEFEISPVSLSFQPDSKSYQYLVEISLRQWLNDHFSFTYKAKTEGEKLNGTFKPASADSRAKGKKS